MVCRQLSIERLRAIQFARASDRDPVLQDTQLPLLVGDLYARLLVEEADARDEP
jgi:hypothetical protein